MWPRVPPNFVRISPYIQNIFPFWLTYTCHTGWLTTSTHCSLIWAWIWVFCHGACIWGGQPHGGIPLGFLKVCLGLCLLRMFEKYHLMHPQGHKFCILANILWCVDQCSPSPWHVWKFGKCIGRRFYFRYPQRHSCGSPKVGRVTQK